MDEAEEQLQVTIGTLARQVRLLSVSLQMLTNVVKKSLDPVANATLLMALAHLDDELGIIEAAAKQLAEMFLGGES